ncbi:MAG: large conductance mechanosensitive channel protein MscL [Prochlorococcus sp.]|jgi:large conductance mechanosensitive channel|tara:strand:- start:845 stop:1249 length:405 start_codon:yes stop_codon:yes gene_type:complete
MASRRKVAKVVSDFRSFINRGNVVDLAVAVVVGGAFSKVVDAIVKLVTGAVMEPIMQKLKVNTLSAMPGGSLLVSVANFLVIAFVVFLVVQALESFKRTEEVLAQEKPVEETDSQQQLAIALQRLTAALERRQI